MNRVVLYSGTLELYSIRRPRPLVPGTPYVLSTPAIMSIHRKQALFIRGTRTYCCVPFSNIPFVYSVCVRVFKAGEPAIIVYL